jgi:2-polyprenyl-3-methyl-5-hydroxy-6-metoxy-1,4-benzoquinol methylase
MPDCFQDKYAHYYDLIYKDKDYGKECAYLERIFQKYAAGRVQRVLDIACGTGGHIIPLAERGYKVSGRDASAAMTGIARKKARQRGLKVKFCVSKMQHLETKEKFDAAIGMFSCIDYLTKVSDLKHALKRIRAALTPEGIFTFDFWNKDCVRRKFAPFKKKIVYAGDIKIIRLANTSLEGKNSIANVTFVTFCLKKRGRLIRTKELHRMKYYRIKEMEKILEQCGFRLLGCFPFLKFGHRPTPSDWNISVVAAPKVKA